MVFQPANPTAEDYRKPFAAFLIAAVPGAKAYDDAVTAAETALTQASAKAADASRKLADMTGADGPRANVSRTAFNRADDAARAARDERAAAERAYDRAAKARFDFMYGPGDELGALYSDDFKAQVEPLFAEASRRAKDHLDALRAALTERAEFASMLGRTIDVEGGNWGLRDALAKASAHVDAGLVDESTREVDRAVALVNKVLSENIMTADRKAEVAAAASAVLDSPDPVAAVANVLRRFKLA